MPITGMNHFTILTDDVEATREFYCDFLDLEVGARPPFDFPGLWLYKNGQAILHVIGGRPRSELRPGVLDHMALSATGLAETVAKLQRRNIQFDLRRVARTGNGVWQLFFHDPNGVKVEFDFDAAEPAPAGY
jgi:catechol 2,3-dioxygenase-like lactoylglutathione lyase family enzyme